MLFDGGSFYHNFGLDTATYRTNFRKVEPFPIQTAGGIVFMDQQCDLAMHGIYISNGFVNDYIPTTLVSEVVFVQPMGIHHKHERHAGQASRRRIMGTATCHTLPSTR